MYFEVSMNTLGGTMYIIRQVNQSNALTSTMDNRAINSSYYTLFVNNTDDQIRLNILRANSSQEYTLKVDYRYYTSAEAITFSSDAYTLGPIDRTSNNLPPYSTINEFEIFRGSVISQIRLLGTEVDTTITLTDLDDFIQFETYSRGIPKSKHGKEVIVRFILEDLYNDGVFYTDSMGLEMQRRQLNYRPSWDYEVVEPIAGNYYPINHGMYLRDQRTTFQVLNDRSQGGSSFYNGTVEMMIDRRMFHYNKNAVHEVLNVENHRGHNHRGLPLLTNHYVRFYDNNETLEFTQTARWKQREIDMPLVYIFGSVPNTIPSEIESSMYVNSATYNLRIPDQIKILVQPQFDGSIYFRLENILDCSYFPSE